MRFFAVAAALLMPASAAPVPRGQPATLGIANASSDTLECHAIAGHWYGFDLGEIARGGRGKVALLYDRTSGIIAMENAEGRPVPLQSIYCGRQGDAWRTRSILPLRGLLDGATEATCREEKAGLDCR